jgi:NhaA family Na+:H+ antiporter
MAVFFLLVGLELKRELLEGQLSNRSQLALPVVAATGGFIVTAIVFILFSLGDATALKGWAIPSATDIAFALGVLSLFGSRIPLSVKVLLASLAIIDDLAAIIVIALFYTIDLSTEAVGIAAIGAVILIAMNLLNVTRIAAYVLVGVVIWVAVLKKRHSRISGRCDSRVRHTANFTLCETGFRFWSEPGAKRFSITLARTHTASLGGRWHCGWDGIINRV